MSSSPDKSILQRYTRSESEGLGLGGPEPEGSDDLGAFGWQRGRERCVMIELRKKTGNVLALGFAWLHRIEFDPSEGVTLHFSGQPIRIRGRNLNAEARGGVRLLDGLVRHRIPWIREASSAENLQAPEDGCLVESIEWE